jgi:hypothetical protein
MAVGVWTLVEKSGYLSVLASSTFAASAYILIFAGTLVMVTGFLGFGAIIREQKSCLSTVSVPCALRVGRGQYPPVRFPSPGVNSTLRPVATIGVAALGSVVAVFSRSLGPS